MSKKKGKRLVDVLDEEYTTPPKDLLKIVTEKFVKLNNRVVTNSKMPKHNTDVKWCSDMVDKIGEGNIPSREEMKTANILWRQYK